MLNVFKDVQNEKYVKQKEEFASKKGIVQFDDFIEFDKVPIVTPNGDVLAKSVSFRINSGQHCLISGPSLEFIFNTKRWMWKIIIIQNSWRFMACI
jgi:ABC-type uncharacterized transport system fused permease/ATPase subunit